MLLTGLMAPRRALALAASGFACACLVVGLSAGSTASADESGQGSSGARPAAVVPRMNPDMNLRLDDRADLSSASDPRVAGPMRLDERAPIKEVPYRVEPARSGVAPSSPWDLPPEVPDARDFDKVETLDEMMNGQFELREEIWNTPEDFITSEGYSRYGGLAFVPFWARNTIRYGRAAIFPWTHVEGAWYSNPESTSGRSPAWEILVSAGVLAEYQLNPGHTKLKASVRADYHWYDTELSDAWSGLVGLELEHRINRRITLNVGAEYERAQVAIERNSALFPTDSIIERANLFGDVLWDRFFSDDLQIDVGASYTNVNEVKTDAHGGDYDDLQLFARLGYAIMRHESFLYGEFRYETRDANGDTSSLDSAEEVRVGINNVLPQARTRRLVGNAWVGYRWENYSASNSANSVGAGEDDSVSLFTFGGDLTYRPSPYTSGYLSFIHTNTFSAVANYNTVDAVTLEVTQNLSNRLLGRLAAAWSRIEPSNDSDPTNRLTLGAGLRYAVSDNLDLTADYEYSHRFAGAGLEASDGNRIAVGVTLQFR